MRAWDLQQVILKQVKRNGSAWEVVDDDERMKKWVSTFQPKWEEKGWEVDLATDGHYINIRIK